MSLQQLAQLETLVDGLDRTMPDIDTTPLLLLPKPHRTTRNEQLANVRSTLEARYEAVQSILRKLNAFSDATRATITRIQNAEAPVMALPSELLLLIMQEAVSSTNYYPTHVARDLSHVCAHWRSIAVTTSALWANFQAAAPGSPLIPRIIGISLARASGCRLCIYLDEDNPTSSYFHDRIMYDPPEITLNHRVRELNILGGSELIDTIADCLFPALEELTLSYTGNHNYKIYGLDSTSLPSLKHLCLGHVDFDRRLINRQLLSFAIHSAYFSPHDLVDLLSTAPDLQSLDIGSIQNKSDTFPLTSCHALALRDLSVVDTTAIGYLEFLQAPSLQELEIKLYGKGSNRLDQITNFVRVRYIFSFLLVIHLLSIDIDLS